MVVVKSEFFLALNQVATERGISADDVIASIEAAVLAAYKKDYVPVADESDETKEITVKIKSFRHKQLPTLPAISHY